MILYFQCAISRHCESGIIMESELYLMFNESWMSSSLRWAVTILPARYIPSTKALVSFAITSVTCWKGFILSGTTIIIRLFGADNVLSVKQFGVKRHVNQFLRWRCLFHGGIVSGNWRCTIIIQMSGGRASNVHGALQYLIPSGGRDETDLREESVQDLKTTTIKIPMELLILNLFIRWFFIFSSSLLYSEEESQNTIS